MIICHLKKIAGMIVFFIFVLIALEMHNCIWAQPGVVCPFNLLRDRHQVLKIFKKNHKDLADDDNYSPEYMIKYRKPDKNAQCLGFLKIKVIREKNKVAGFTAYYMENEKKALVLFLAVDDVFRGKGYGTKLIQFALDDLQLMGAETIGIWVSLDNNPAKKIYKNVGFIEKYIHEEKRNLYLECMCTSKKA